MLRQHPQIRYKLISKFLTGLSHLERTYLKGLLCPTLTSLPDDLMIDIIRYLEIKDILSLFNCSSRFHDLDCEFTWKQIYENITLGQERSIHITSYKERCKLLLSQDKQLVKLNIDHWYHFRDIRSTAKMFDIYENYLVVAYDTVLLSIHDLTNQKEMKNIYSSYGHVANCIAVTKNENGIYIATGGTNFNVNIFKLSEDFTINKSNFMPTHENTVSGLLFVNNCLYSSGHDGKMIKFELDGLSLDKCIETNMIFRKLALSKEFIVVQTKDSLCFYNQELEMIEELNIPDLNCFDCINDFVFVGTAAKILVYNTNNIVNGQKHPISIIEGFGSILISVCERYAFIQSLNESYIIPLYRLISQSSIDFQPSVCKILPYKLPKYQAKWMHNTLYWFGKEDGQINITYPFKS